MINHKPTGWRELGRLIKILVDETGTGLFRPSDDDDDVLEKKLKFNSAVYQLFTDSEKA